MNPKRRDCFNFGFSMSHILGIHTESGKTIPVYQLENPPSSKRQVTIKELKETEKSYDCDDCCNALMVMGRLDMVD
jgi:hypothetical protein